jgi:AmmeMemoRadiSam system protein B
MDCPKLRPVNAFPVQMSGQSLICLQDPQKISEKTLFLPPPLYFVVSHFDGEHSILDIQAEYMRNFGEFLFTEKIQEIIEQLEENLFLEGDRFQEALRREEERFKQSSVREATLAGRSYEKDPERLKLQLKEYFEAPEGPGPIGQRQGTDGLKGVIAPHIDLQRGGHCYAFAHREVGEKSSARCFIILGTAHAPMQTPFCLTRKDFMTPLGPLEVDRELVNAIQANCPYDLFLDESVHRMEHSVEFQCVFLRYLMPDPAPVRIVPILAGSFHESIERGISPMELPRVREFIQALRETVSPLEEEVCYVASADLSHVGLQFGDREGVTDYQLRRVADEDQDLLKYVEKMDGEGFFLSIARDRDRRRVCGLPAIYCMLHGLHAAEGKILKYGQAITPETQSVVSFASLAFYG